MHHQHSSTGFFQIPEFSKYYSHLRLIRQKQTTNWCTGDTCWALHILIITTFGVNQHHWCENQQMNLIQAKVWAALRHSAGAHPKAHPPHTSDSPGWHHPVRSLLCAEERIKPTASQWLKLDPTGPPYIFNQKIKMFAMLLLMSCWAPLWPIFNTIPIS